MKYWKTALSIFALSSSVALAEDFKTIKGKEYKNASVSRVEPDGIILKTKSGIVKVYFAELPKEVQERFKYNPASAAQFSATTQAATAQPRAATPQQQTQTAAENLHTIREVESDQPSFLDQPFILKGKIDVSDYYNYGYERGQGTHFAFEITDSSAHPCNAYMERAKATRAASTIAQRWTPVARHVHCGLTHWSPSELTTPARTDGLPS